MSIQQNFPAISPSLNLNFARSKTLDPRITFSRTSTATRVNEQGLVEVVSADIPRFDHEYDSSTGVIKSLGLLVEEQRSNLVPYSLVFNNTTYWVKFNTFTITPNYDTAPDGTTTASRIVTNGTTSNNRIEQTISTGITTNTTYDFSLYIKKNGTASSGRIRLDILNSSGDLLDASNFSVSDNWEKVDVSGSSGTGSSIKIRIRESTDSSAAIDALIWGAQLEAGAFPTSYIPTSGSTATRNRDTVSMTGDNFSDWYNQSEGSFYMNIRNIQQQPTGSAYTRLIDLRGTPTGDNYYLLAIVPNGRAIYNEMFSNGSSQLNYSATYPVPNSPTGIVKITTGLQQNNFIAYNFASQFLSDTSSVTLPILNTLYIGRDQNGGSQINGHISKLTYYPTRLSNDQLQNLTK